MKNTKQVSAAISIIILILWFVFLFTRNDVIRVLIGLLIGWNGGVSIGFLLLGGSV